MARHDEFKKHFLFLFFFEGYFSSSCAVFGRCRVSSYLENHPSVLSFEYPYAPMKWNLKEKSAC